MRKLNLDKFQEDWLGIPSNAGNFYYTALLACLQGNGHKSGCLLQVSGDWEEALKLSWSDELALQLSLLRSLQI